MSIRRGVVEPHVARPRVQMQRGRGQKGRAIGCRCLKVFHKKRKRDKGIQGSRGSKICAFSRNATLARNARDNYVLFFGIFPGRYVSYKKTVMKQSRLAQLFGSLSECRK